MSPPGVPIDQCLRFLEVFRVPYYDFLVITCTGEHTFAIEGKAVDRRTVSPKSRNLAVSLPKLLSNAENTAFFDVPSEVGQHIGPKFV